MSREEEKKELLPRPPSRCEQTLDFIKQIPEKPLWKWFWNEFYALSYNIETTTTYWISADNFPKHMEWLNNPVSIFETPWTVGPFIVCCIGEISLFLSTQRNTEKLTRARGHNQLRPTWIPSFLQCKNAASSKWACVELYLSTGWKSAVSSTSFWALVKDILDLIPSIAAASGVSLFVSGILALITLYPNLAAQYVNFSNGRLPYCCFSPTTCAKILAFFYAICNGALYFNTFNKVFVRYPLVGGNLSELDNLPKQCLFSLNTGASMHFTLETYRCYKTSVFNALTRTDQNDSPVHLRTSARIAANWKVVVTTLGFIAILGDLFGSNGLIAGFVISAIFLRGNRIVQKNFFTEPTEDRGLLQNQPENDENHINLAVSPSTH